MDVELHNLVYGYLRLEFLGSIEYHYPESLTAIFIQFLGNIIFPGFDIIPDEYKDFVSDDCRVFKINGDKCNKTISVGCSYPFHKGIYTVTVKY